MNDDFLYGKDDDEILKISGKELKRAFVSARLRKVCECKNRTILMDKRNRTLECSECGAILDPFDVCAEMAEQEDWYVRNIKFLKSQKEELERWMQNNRMGQKLRDLASNLRQGRIPECPECNHPFDIENITAYCSKEYAVRLKQQEMFAQIPKSE